VLMGELYPDLDMRCQQESVQKWIFLHDTMQIRGLA
jgi:hypothetical protein